tara:strand:- start:374 stop:670 length:297 start_codon:yes stop_codon:yes gene_type:complete
MRLVITTLLLLIFLSSCQTVQTKVDEKTQSILDKMGQYIGHSLNEVYIDYGKEGVHSSDYKGYKKVTFTTKKLGVKCKRIFFYDRSMIVSSIKFAGCW